MTDKELSTFAAENDLDAVNLIAKEREKQIGLWGGTDKDAKWVNDELATAAGVYVLSGLTPNPADVEKEIVALGWPFEKEAFKPVYGIQDLVKGAALLAAEIDRRLQLQK